jgi:hypothetical protein
MAALTPEQQTFIMAEFARSKKVPQIIKSVKTEFKLDLDRQQIWHYHPENPKLAKQWRDLYEEFRKALMNDAMGDVAAHKGFRVGELRELYYAAKEQGNTVLCADLLKQIAQEVGEVFTNKRTLNVNARESLAALLGVDPNELPEQAGK